MKKIYVILASWEDQGYSYATKAFTSKDDAINALAEHYSSSLFTRSGVRAWIEEVDLEERV